MYRQMLIYSAESDLLKIIWKDREDAYPTEFRIKTVTHGTANALFLAIRTLKQLSLDESSRFPLALDVTLQDMYICASNDQEHKFLSTTEPSVNTRKPAEDTFSFKVSIIKKASYAKGDVFSVIASLYDPLGFIGPVITKAKMFLQKLWQLKVNWDDELPESFATQWTHFVGSLKFIEELHIDRYLLADAIKMLRKLLRELWST
ncbi:hypothetical protein AVEN_26484-1 [Araneus ventricosus]|uniref:Uncharacterized protein n=1 Tax=Araneus ventricosus TaxID=182803 RepID=A0A4Y2CSI0_ARAVE|nr:hypothetical protein AVEN_26484-1 [Araneus ventricosus]